MMQKKGSGSGSVLATAVVRCPVGGTRLALARIFLSYDDRAKRVDRPGTLLWPGPSPPS
jgi:hypothetical protein